MHDDHESFVTEAKGKYGAVSEFLRFRNGAPLITRVLEGFLPHQLAPMREAQFVIFKPDAVASGKVLAILDRLASLGIGLLWFKPLFRFDEHQYEELYRYNIDLDHPKCMVGSLWSLRQPFALNTAIGALIGPVEPGRVADLYVETKRLKGESTPYLARPGQLRYDLNGSSKTLNLIHVSDDPISGLRELRIFCEPDEVGHLLDELARPGSADRAGELHGRNRARLARLLDMLGPRETDGDFPAATLRTAAKLVCSIADHHGLQHLLEDETFAAPPQGLGPCVRAAQLRDRLRVLSAVLAHAPARRQRWQAAATLELLQLLCDLDGWSTEKISYVLGAARSFGIQISDWDALMISSNAFFIAMLQSALDSPHEVRTEIDPSASRMQARPLVSHAGPREAARERESS